jgi:putative transposase
MPDHLHMLASFGPDLGMKRVIANWKRYTANHAGIHWQRDFFDHRLRNDESFDEKAAYILENPVRAGLAHRVEDWPYQLQLRSGCTSGASVEFFSLAQTATAREK